MSKIVRRILLLLFIVLGWSGAQAETLNLNGEWDFLFTENADWKTVYSPAFQSEDIIAVPSCFDALTKWSKKRGTAQYRKRFFLSHDVINAWLTVEGMGLRGRFFVDDKEMGECTLPYSTFQIPTGALRQGWHTLYVVMSNMLDESKSSLFHQYYDFYAYGGFYHGVSLQLQNDKAGFYKVQVRTRNYKTGEVELELLTHNSLSSDMVKGKVWFDEAVVPQILKFQQGKVVVKVPHAQLWSPSSPHLHTVKVELDGVQQSTRFGIREVKAEGAQILLNGEKLYLRGANRHETFPIMGATTTEAVMMQDLLHLRALGANFVRGAHYPQCSRFLDLCDEMGFLVWEETLGWNNTPEQLKDEQFMKQQREQMKIMVQESLNHPSVIITGFLNENKSKSEEAYLLISQLVKIAREAQTGHLISFACNDNKTDICHKLTDIVAFNTYPGWIGTQAGSPENLEKIVKADVETIVSHYSECYPDKPVIVSEMGTCGVYGMHDADAPQWTEEFQAEYVEAVLKATMNNPRLSGVCIWQLNDSPSYYRDGGTIRSKPFAMNLAGLYDEFRRPKMVTQIVKKYWK